MSEAVCESETVAEVYLHVGNSGLTVKVVDAGYGPTLAFECSSFGNLTVRHETMTTVEGLKAVRDMLDRAIARGVYSGPYCHPARPAGTEDGPYPDGDPVEGGPLISDEAAP